jgi:hypothetical protein
MLKPYFFGRLSKIMRPKNVNSNPRGNNCWRPPSQAKPKNSKACLLRSHHINNNKNESTAHKSDLNLSR